MLKAELQQLECWGQRSWHDYICRTDKSLKEIQNSHLTWLTFTFQPSMQAAFLSVDLHLHIPNEELIWHHILCRCSLLLFVHPSQWPGLRSTSQSMPVTPSDTAFLPPNVIQAGFAPELSGTANRSWLGNTACPPGR